MTTRPRRSLFTYLQSARRQWWLKWMAIGVMGASGLLLIQALPIEPLSRSLQETVEGWGAWSPLFFSAVYALAVLVFIPASFLTLVAGALFGFWKGTVVVSIAANAGASIAFLIARYLARERVQHQVRQSPKLSAIDQSIGKHGWKIVALLRLSPVIPFTLQNYLYGVTAIRFWPWLFTSWLAMLPGTFAYVYVGTLGSAAVSRAETSAGEWILRAVGLVATIVVTVYLARLAKRAMQEQIDVPIDEMSLSEALSSDVPPKKSSLPRLAAWWSVAVVLLALALWTHWHKDRIRHVVAEWIGQPIQVEREEP